jgi:hypothetical protein
MVQSVRSMFLASLVFSGAVALAAFAQTQTPAPKQTPTQAPSQTQTPSENTGTEGTLAPGMTINAELNSTLDSKKVKPGDPVTAKATEAVKSSDGRTILPKGAKLVGKVTESKARSKGDSESMLGIQFDKAMLKDGEAVGLTNVAIQAIAPPASSASAFSSGPPMSGGAGAPSGSAPSNPSMSGSQGARTSGNTGSQTQYPNSGGEMSGGQNASGPLPPNSKGVYGIEGLRIGVAPGGAGATSVITSAGKNVHLDGGTRLLLAPAQQSAAGPSGR